MKQGAKLQQKTLLVMLAALDDIEKPARLIDSAIHGTLGWS
jgi:hypothetical protein